MAAIRANERRRPSRLGFQCRFCFIHRKRSFESQFFSFSVWKFTRRNVKIKNRYFDMKKMNIKYLKP